MSIHKVMVWAGHSDISITVSRYAHLRPEDSLDALNVLEDKAPYIMAAVPSS